MREIQNLNELVNTKRKDISKYVKELNEFKNILLNAGFISTDNRTYSFTIKDTLYIHVTIIDCGIKSMITITGNACDLNGQWYSEYFKNKNTFKLYSHNNKEEPQFDLILDKVERVSTIIINNAIIK